MVSKRLAAALVCGFALIPLAALAQNLEVIKERQGLVVQYDQLHVLQRQIDLMLTGRQVLADEAHAMGLVDRLGTMRGEIARRYPDAEIVTVEGRRPLLARLGLVPAAGGRGGPETALAMLEALEHRAAWSRFGL